MAEFIFGPFYLRQEFRYLLNRRLGGSGRFEGEEKTSGLYWELKFGPSSW
jgi:hypothetical protein